MTSASQRPKAVALAVHPPAKASTPGVGRPGPLRRQVVRGLMVRVAVVQLGVGRDAEAAAGRGAPAQVRHDPAARRDRRAPGGTEAVVAIDPDAGLDHEPRADRLPQLDDSAGARKRALAERGRIDGVPAGRGAERQLRRRAERGAPAGVGRHRVGAVAVVREGRTGPVVDEAVAVRAVGAVDRQQRAAARREPMLGAHQRLIGPFAGRRGAVEPGRSELLVQVAQGQRRALADGALIARQLDVVIAIRREACRSVELAGEHVLDRLCRQADRGRALDQVVLAEGDVGGEARTGPPGDDVDGAADGVGAVDGRPAAQQDLDALDVEQRHRHVAVVVPRLGVVEPGAVDQHQRLAEGGAADGEVGLDAPRSALAHLDAGHQAQRVDRGGDGQAGEVLAGQDDDRAAEAAERVGRDGSGDDDGLAHVGRFGRRRLGRLRRGRRGATVRGGSPRPDGAPKSIVL